MIYFIIDVMFRKILAIDYFRYFLNVLCVFKIANL